MAEQPAGNVVRTVRIVFLLACLSALLVLGALLRGGSSAGGAGAGSAAGPTSSSPLVTPSAMPSGALDPAAFLYPTARVAPPLALIDPEERSFALTALRGDLVLVFFGYTHCPDVCPATVGTVGEAMRAYGQGVRAVFVTVDPERDTPAWLTEYSRYLPAGFTALTGTADQVRAAADAWGVRYARVETGTPGAYSMSHTADVYLVDAAGQLRARFPFGTESAAMAAVLRSVAASTPVPAGSASAGPSATPAQPATATALRAEIVSSSVWSGGASPVILALYGPAGRLNDTSIRATVQLTTLDGAPTGSPVQAIAVKPPGVEVVSFVATVDIPSPGSWRLAVTAQAGALPLSGSTGLLNALDPGATPALGTPAPTIHTPTLDDIGGDVRQVSTDPVPDLRLYRRSTSDALAEHTPFVLVLDSNRFRVTSACGRALIMAKYLLDRWPQVTFVHHEPYRYSIVTDTPVLQGSLADPVLTEVATAWGIGDAPWGARSMPWIFIVDGNGLVRAKYQGVAGSDDVDVIVAWLTQGG
ncbi:MAG: SCO family protein [Candidatus Limnocylindrales bacterium]